MLKFQSFSFFLVPINFSIFDYITTISFNSFGKIYDSTISRFSENTDDILAIHSPFLKCYTLTIDY